MSNSLRNHTRLARTGFTIIELLIAIIISAIVSAIVYSTFSSVLASTETAEVASEQLYTQSFLSRHLNTHVAQASSGWQPGAVFRPYTDASSPVATVMEESFMVFTGEDKGEEDSLSFITSAPMFGASGYPGYLKQVSYSIVDAESIDLPEGSPYALQEAEGSVLLVTEVPIMTYTNLTSVSDAERRIEELRDHVESLELATPIWTFPISAMDLRFHDGDSWVDDWDYESMERLPWAIEVNLYWSPWGENRTVSLEPDSQFQLIVTVPGGVGVENAHPEYRRPVVEVPIQ